MADKDRRADWKPQTQLVRGGQMRSPFSETAEALYLTSGFVYDSAEEAEAAFKNEGSRFVYSRYSNPTVAMFEERLRLLEGAETCAATPSGMAAVAASMLCFLK
ncbi:MAG: PLP-dependent transferase, partial [Oceanibaculum sp.]